MRGKSLSDGRVIGARRPDDVRGWLALLKSHLERLEETAGLETLSRGTRSPSPEVLHLVSGLSDAVGQIMAEHTGMAEELLSVYEQLGVVFEVTCKLPSIRNESEVLDLFIDSLSTSFYGRDVFLVHPPSKRRNVETSGRVPCDGDCVPCDGWLTAQIERARDERRVIVEAPPTGTMQVPSSAMGTTGLVSRETYLVSRRTLHESAAADFANDTEKDGMPSSGQPIVQVMIGPVFAGENFVCAIVIARASDITEFHASDMSVIESLSTFCGDVIRNHRLVRELGEMSVAMVRSLVNAVDEKDPYTSGHSLRVAYYAVLLGRELGLGKVDLRMLQWSALLHDVGKIGIREAVLNKEGKLTEEEFDHIREHPVRGYHVVKEVQQLADALDGVLHHHERYDGSGYPTRLAAENIPIQARIVQIADVFDALTSTRSYRPAFDWRKALSIMKEEAGKMIDPHLQTVFDRLMRGMLEDDLDAWEQVIKRAGQFARVLQEPTWQEEGE